MENGVTSMNGNEDVGVLFLVHQYDPNPKPCEVCVMRVQQSLLNLGIRSDVLEYNGQEGLVKTSPCGNVYSIGAAKPKVDTTKKNMLVEYSKKIPLLFRWPCIFNKDVRLKYRAKVDELNKKNHYKAIIGLTLPVDTAIVASEYDNFIHYELDAVANNPEYKRGIKKLYRGRLNRIERHLYEKAKLIIHVEFNRRYLEKYRESDYYKKFVYSDIPNLVEPTRHDDYDYQSDNVVHFAYFGALVRDYRNPTYLIQVLKKLNQKVKIQCEFFTRGNCEDIISDSAKENPEVIIQRGYVDQETVARKQNAVDFLVSIGNKLTGTDYSLPSKTIEYIAMGKPIIHIAGGDNDSAIAYLKKYDLACIIYQNEDINNNIDKLIRFVKESKGKRVPFETVKKKFYHNSPDYTAKIIKDFLDRG